MVVVCRGHLRRSPCARVFVSGLSVSVPAAQVARWIAMNTSST